MAIEAENVLQAALQFDGRAASPPQIHQSRGVDQASFQAAAPGAYLVNLVDPVDPFAIVCAGNAQDAGGVALKVVAAVAVVGPDYVLGIRCYDNANALAEPANCQVQVTKFITEG